MQLRKKQMSVHLAWDASEPEGVPVTYAGFWMRLAAGIVDFIVYFPIIILYWGLASLSWEIAVVVTIPYVCANAVYNVCFHGRWGQTVGKMALRIKVVRVNGDPIRYVHAFWRHCIDLLISALSSVAWMIALLSITRITFESAGFTERTLLVKSSQPIWEDWLDYASSIWVCSEAGDPRLYRRHSCTQVAGRGRAR
jgi:uncharacterized RDD family membrane protein YckC